MPPPAPTQPLGLLGPQDNHHLINNRPSRINQPQDNNNNFFFVSGTPRELQNFATSLPPPPLHQLSTFPDHSTFQHHQKRNNLGSEASPGDSYEASFRPSLPDFRKTNLRFPLTRTQGYASVSNDNNDNNGEFRPSQLLSVTRLTSEAPEVTKFGGIKIQRVLENKDTNQYASFGSNYLNGQTVNKHKSLESVQPIASPQLYEQDYEQDNPLRPLAFPPLPFLEQGLQQRPRDEYKQPYNYQRGGGRPSYSMSKSQAKGHMYRHYDATSTTTTPSLSRPTSIQDIINSDYDTAQHLYKSGKASVERENHRWHWPMY